MPINLLREAVRGAGGQHKAAEAFETLTPPRCDQKREGSCETALKAFTSAEARRQGSQAEETDAVDRR